MTTELTPITQAQWALTEAKTPEQSKEVEAMAAAAKAWAKEQNHFELVVEAGRIYILARRNTTELIDPYIEHGGDHTSERWEQRDDVVTLLDFGFTRKQWSRRKKELEVTNEDIENYIDDCIEKNAEPTVYGLLRFASEDWYQSSANDDWWTPQWLFDLLDKEFGFELDVCASDENHKCDRYFTRDDNALDQEWSGVCWMNPPYGRSGGTDIYDWIEKAYQSALDGATLVCFIPARTDTKWWWDFCIHGEVRFMKGRIKFDNSDSIAPFPSAVIIFRPELLEDPKVVWWWVSKDG